jgi:phytoene dehydrogenase-like protein
MTKGETAMGKRGTINLALGFLPWLVFGLSGAAGHGPAATAAAFLAAAVLVGWRLRRGDFKAPEGVALAYFAARLGIGVAGIVVPPSVEPVALFAVLAAMAWGTLLAGRPFTEQYARDDWPPEYHANPVFRRTNVLISAAWAMAFTALAAIFALPWPAGIAPGWLSVPVVVLAKLATLAASRWLPRRAAVRRLRAQAPYDWPAPALATGGSCDVAVVGAGLGGLTAAALLAREGFKVTVAEQHTRPGGCCTSWVRNMPIDGRRHRFVFDAGVHDVSGLGPGRPLRNVLERLGIAGKLTWHRMTHEYLWPDLRLTIPPTADGLAEVLAARFPASADGIRAFLAEMRRVHTELFADADARRGVPHPPRTVDALLAWPRRHPAAFLWMERPFAGMLEAFVADPAARRCLGALTGYLTDRPAELTVGMMAPIFGYYFEGGFYPQGGSQALADALAGAISANGGRVLLRRAVRHIRIEVGRAAGIELADGRTIPAAAVIANADPRLTFLRLVGREHLPSSFADRVAGLHSSTSAFTVFLGLDAVPDISPLTSIHAADGVVQIATPSLVDPGLAPPGWSAMTLTALVPAAEAAAWRRDDEGYAGRKRILGDRLIARAEAAVPGLGRHVRFREEASPATFARYTWAPDGGIYGPALGPWRPPAKSPIPGLVLAGAGTFPGAGVEAAAISGALAAEALLPSLFAARPAAAETPAVAPDLGALTSPAAPAGSAP